MTRLYRRHPSRFCQYRAPVPGARLCGRPSPTGLCKEHLDRQQAAEIRLCCLLADLGFKINSMERLMSGFKKDQGDIVEEHLQEADGPLRRAEEGLREVGDKELVKKVQKVRTDTAEVRKELQKKLEQKP